MAEKKEGMSRRKFLKNSGLVVGGALGGGLITQLGRGAWQEGPEESELGQQQPAQRDYSEARTFFTRDEDFRVLEMAAETIFPEDDNGPGAIALGVPYFIDHQLTGYWGYNARDYRQGPFMEGTETQGYQSSLNRREIFLKGLRRINEVSLEEYDEAFADLEEDDRFEILMRFSTNDIEMTGVTSARFFSLLRQAVIEGVYTDPVYGGNKNLEGWKMKGYPGSIMSYLHVIQEEEFVEMEPMALKDHHS